MTALTLQGTPAFNASGKFGSSLNGGNGYVTVAPFTGYPFTIEALVKATASGNIEVAAGKGGVGWFGKAADNTALAHFGSGSSGTTAGKDITLSSSVNITDGAYHLLRLVVTALGGTFYVDNMDTPVSSSTAAPVFSNANQYFGVRAFFGAAASTTVTFPFQGEVEEVSVWTTDRSGAAAPTAAYAGSEPGLAALWHLDGNGDDSAGTPVAATAITLTGPTTGAIGAASSPFTVAANGTITGAVVVTPSDSSGGGTFSPSSVSINSGTPSATFTYTAGSAGAKSISATNNGSLTNAAAITYTAAAAAAGIDTSKMLFSPVNWSVSAGSAKTINDGAYFKLGFSGSSCTLGFDISGTSNPKPKMCYRVDGVGAWMTVDLAASIAITMPTETAAMPNHSLEVRVAQTSEAVSRWNPQNTAVVVNSITLASGGVQLAAPAAKPLRGAFLGDSIHCGVNSMWLATNDSTTRGRAQMAYPYYMEDALGAEIGVVAFGGQGWSVTGGGSVPVFPSTWNSIFPGVVRDFTGLDFIVVVQGQNDGNGTNVTAAVTSWLNSLLAVVDRRCQVIVASPLTQKHASELVAAIAACSAPALVKYFDTTGLFVAADAVDSVHPGGYAHQSKIAPGFASFLRPLLSPVKGGRTARTVSLTLCQDADGLIPVAPATGLVAALFDQASPDKLSIAADNVTGIAIGAGGQCTFTAYSTLAAGAAAYLVLSNADGSKAFRGKVVLS